MSIKKLTVKQKAFLAIFEKGATNVSIACKKVGVSRNAYYEWLNKNDNFKQKVDEAKQSMIDFAESSLYKQIKDGNTTATIFFLKTQAKDRGYIETRENIITGEPHKFSPAELYGDTKSES